MTLFTHAGFMDHQTPRSLLNQNLQKKKEIRQYGYQRMSQHKYIIIQRVCIYKVDSTKNSFYQFTKKFPQKFLMIFKHINHINLVFHISEDGSEIFKHCVIGSFVINRNS